jgi:hypothetical protein
VEDLVERRVDESSNSIDWIKPVIVDVRPLRAEHMTEAVAAAKRILSADEAVLYGIYGVIGKSRFFPPRAFLNEFLMGGCDPCDQDGRMGRWQPLSLSPAEYEALKAWWVANHPGAVEESLGVDRWDDWVQEILDR